MMSSEKMRAEFEAFWIAPEQAELRASCAQGWAFEVWQASRASLVVELPMIDISLSSCRTDEWCEGVVHATGKYREAIEAAGVRVKS